jgi:hypothetical protein
LPAAPKENAAGMMSAAFSHYLIEFVIEITI